MNGHVFKTGEVYCKKCGWHHSHYNDVNCNEIFNKSKTHIWNDKKTKCLICEIDGQYIKYKNLNYVAAWSWHNGSKIKIYTCNEYLMIKVNE